MSPEGESRPHTWYLGNDVVDLADPRCRGKAQDVRFLKRVFSEEEREAILGASDPDSALWTHWAGKEAIFKSASKALGSPPVFHHPLFGVTGLTAEAPEGSYEEFSFSLKIFRTPTSIHAVSWCRGPSRESPAFKMGMTELAPGGPAWRDELKDRFSPREWHCISHQGSALTRLAARQALSTAMGVGEDTLEIGCGDGPPGRRIPTVFHGTAEASVDLSLSHHGRFQAWVFHLS